MIYVRRDVKEIPARVLKVAERAQQRLETLDPDGRAAFISRKAHIWRAFAKYLRGMSYGKCWYSESPDPQSFFDIDHYRPKGEARRSEKEVDAGYEWLAFDWENFRISAQRSNRCSKNEESNETVGKGSWFPLLTGSPVACWEDRCESKEKPILLDPTRKRDVRLLEVEPDGRIGASPWCTGSDAARVRWSIELYGLNLPGLKAARLKVMREVIALTDILTKSVAAGRMLGAVGDEIPIDEQLTTIRWKTAPSAPYSKATRNQLRMLGMPELCEQPEEVE